VCVFLALMDEITVPDCSVYTRFSKFLSAWVLFNAIITNTHECEGEDGFYLSFKLGRTYYFIIVRISMVNADCLWNQHTNNTESEYLLKIFIRSHGVPY
jgi:hypothetical protein